MPPLWVVALDSSPPGRCTTNAPSLRRCVTVTPSTRWPRPVGSRFAFCRAAAVVAIMDSPVTTGVVVPVEETLKTRGTTSNDDAENDEEGGVAGKEAVEDD